jgi:hypothetical protein
MPTNTPDQIPNPPTPRTLVCGQSGPVELAIYSHDDLIEVIADDTIEYAEVTLTPAVGDTSRETAQLIEKAATDTHGRRFTLRMPHPGGNSGGATVTRSGGHVSIQAGIVTGSVVGLQLGTIDGDVVVGDGVTIVNGNVITGSGRYTVTGAGAARRGGPVRITARVAPGSSVILSGFAPHLTATGPLGFVDVETTAGNLACVDATTVRVKTTSGDVHTARTAEVSARTVSGYVICRELAGSAQIKTISGDITIDAATDSTCHARSVSGDIELSSPAGVAIDATTRTVSGTVRRRERSA